MKILNLNNYIHVHGSSDGQVCRLAMPAGNSFAWSMVFSLMVRCRLTRQLEEVMMLSTRCSAYLLSRFFIMNNGAFTMCSLQGAEHDGAWKATRMISKFRLLCACVCVVWAGRGRGRYSQTPKSHQLS